MLIYLEVSSCIPVVVLKNRESELSNIPVELFNMCLTESCFPDCWKVTQVVPVFKIIIIIIIISLFIVDKIVKYW